MLLNFASKVNALAKQGQPFLFIIDFDLEKPMVFAADEIPADIHFCIPGIVFGEMDFGPTTKNITFRARTPDFESYKKAFEGVQNEINHGNSYLLNLTFQSELETNLGLHEIFARSRAMYKLIYKNDFVVFSPETFVRIQGRKISSFPMKGTIDAGLENAAQVLLNDVKESAEHNTIVDLIRNDLAMVADDVYVEKFKYLEKIKTHTGELLQMSSKISGTLPENYKQNLGDILLKLLPAGSITGAPKAKTVEIIKQTENYTRGFYTGIFGYFDGVNLDSAVMIRFIENENGRLFFKSGGGITSMSEVQKEYDELIQKIYVPIT
jgi:para-aminobenzoate synthetase component 1